MMNQEIEKHFYAQLACDYSCTEEEIRNPFPVLAKKAYRAGRRIFRGDNCFLKILVINGKLVVNAEEEAFLKENENFFKDASAAWFFEPETIRTLDKMLAEYGHEVVDLHHFYLPVNTDTVTAENNSLVLYEREELEKFRGDVRFKEALSFLPQSPDMLAVTWEEEGEILGMAGASADAADWWQIGINILPGGEHRGMGTLLVTRLKEEIMRRGKIPFYGTAQSHIRSQKVAVQSGFVPAWAELYTRSVEDRKDYI